MSFHNRFLSIGLIIAAAKSQEGFPAFEKFMTNSAAHTYLYHDSFAIHHMFVEYPLLRKDLWIIVGVNDAKSIPIKALVKAWDVMKNPENEKKHEQPIQKYLDLVKKCDPKYQIILNDIVNVLKSN